MKAYAVKFPLENECELLSTEENNTLQRELTSNLLPEHYAPAMKHIYYKVNTMFRG